MQSIGLSKRISLSTIGQPYDISGLPETIALRFSYLSRSLRLLEESGGKWRTELSVAVPTAIDRCAGFFERSTPPKLRRYSMPLLLRILSLTERPSVISNSEEDNTFYMSWISTFSTLQGVGIQRSNNISESILEHGLGAQQQMIKSALEKGLPCLERWKLSRLLGYWIHKRTAWSAYGRRARVRAKVHGWLRESVIVVTVIARPMFIIVSEPKTLRSASWTCDLGGLPGYIAYNSGCPCRGAYIILPQTIYYLAASIATT